MRRIVALLGVLTVVAISLPAQAPPGGGYGSGHRPRARGDDASRSGEGALPPLDDISGPPDPGSATQVLTLDQGQRARYAVAWDSLMADTRSQRDTVREMERVVQSALDQGYQRGAREKWDVARQLVKAIRQRDEGFDHAVKKWLTKDQRKIYEDLRNQKDRHPEENRAPGEGERRRHPRN